MSPGDHFHKWLGYLIGLFPVWLLDGYVLSRFPLFGTIPNLLPAAVVAVGLLEGAMAGAGFGLGVGILWVLEGGGGGLILGMTVAGLLCGVAVQSGLKPTFPSYLFSCVLLLLSLGAVRLLWGTINRIAAPQLLLEVALSEFCSSLIWTPLVYGIFRLVYDRVGGDRLA